MGGVLRVCIDRQRTKQTPDQAPHTQPELEINLPDLDRWWVVLQLSPAVELSPEEVARRREAARPGVPQILQDIAFFQKEERRVMKKLESPGHGEDERTYLEAIRTYLRITRSMIEAWGLAGPDGKATNQN
jgi:hypothetical protein